MSSENNNLSDKEKKILLGENTYMSIGITAMLISSVVYVSHLSETARANTDSIKEAKTEISELKKELTNSVRYQSRSIKRISTRLGRIEGKLDVILKRVR